MKSQVFTVLLLTVGASLFQPTHQYRLTKRELTEYDLTSFIVNTCSADKTEMLIQDLCDHTLQSALMGNFPFLTYYCKTIGVGRRFCGSINRHTAAIAVAQNDEPKRFAYRRFVRSINDKNTPNRRGQEPDNEMDLDQLILSMCLTKTDTNSIDTHRFCNRTLQQAHRGRYPEIIRLCKSHPSFAYCQQVVSSSSPLFSWQQQPSAAAAVASSSLSSLSNSPNIILSSGSSTLSTSSVADHHTLSNRKKQQQPHHHHQQQRHHSQQIDV